MDILLFAFAWVSLGMLEFALLRSIAGKTGRWEPIDIMVQALLIILAPLGAPLLILMGIIYCIRHMIERHERSRP